MKVKGKRTVLGVKLPRIKPIGRVPLGKLRTGRSSFKWPVEVDGEQLERGTYLLTFRSLRKKRVLTTSESVRIKVARTGAWCAPSATSRSPEPLPGIGCSAAQS